MIEAGEAYVQLQGMMPTSELGLPSGEPFEVYYTLCSMVAAHDICKRVTHSSMPTLAEGDMDGNVIEHESPRALGGYPDQRKALGRY